MMRMGGIMDTQYRSSISWLKPFLLEEPESKYLAIRRENQVRTATGMGAIALLSLIGYLLFSASFLPQAILPRLTISVIFMALAISAYLMIVRTPAYQSREFIDVLPFTLVLAAQITVNYAFFPLMEEFGSSGVNTVAFNSAVLIAAGACLVVGSFRAFLAIIIVAVAMTVGAFIVWAPTHWHFTQLAPFGTAVAVALFANYTLERVSRTSYAATCLADEKTKEVETLLHNVLPASIAKRLQRGEIVADSYSEVSVIFCDLVGFTELSNRLPPKRLVAILEELFDLADSCAADLQVEKVKTIGDAYMAVAGGAVSANNSSALAIEFGLRLRELLLIARDKHGLHDLDLRVGVHTGPAIGAVIGQVKQTYDYWGDTVNIASRIQGCADPGEVVVSEQTQMAAFADFSFGQAELHDLRGVGDRKVFRVIGRREASAPEA